MRNSGVFLPAQPPFLWNWKQNRTKNSYCPLEKRRRIPKVDFHKSWLVLDKLNIYFSLFYKNFLETSHYIIYTFLFSGFKNYFETISQWKVLHGFQKPKWKQFFTKKPKKIFFCPFPRKWICSKKIPWRNQIQQKDKDL